jgi:hypothetical protein
MNTAMRIKFPSDVHKQYPVSPFSFSHTLADEPLLTHEELLRAANILLPEMIECVSPHKDLHSVIKLIEDINTSSSWFIFRNLEQLSCYKTLLETVIGEIIETGLINKNDYHNPMCFVFLSSPLVKTPFHIDPEHNFLFQISGTKKVKINDHQKRPIITEREIADFYQDEVNYSLVYDLSYEDSLDSVHLNSSNGVYIPVTYPHLVINGNNISISFSVTFRTAMSEEHRLKHLMQ